MDNPLLDKERDIIIQQFGLEDHRPRTMAETVARLGISIDRVGLVEACALLNKLRHPQQNY
jgi:DNA-directed RNA polymerase sigma subunit (sigma70/sigma32)